MHMHEFVERDLRPRAAPAVEHAQTQQLPTQRAALDASAVLSLQRSVGNAGVNQLLAQDEERSPVRDVVESGGGAPLDEQTREFMESRFDHDFSSVRVHTDARASDSAQSVNAHAYTVGSNVVFRSGQYSPETDTGKRLLAHELTHVVQQQSGPVSGTPAPGGILLSTPSDAFEQQAEHHADAVMSSGPASVQREEASEEEESPTAQAYPVQREGEEEEQEA
jgi:Domain of unknown function (DUF4157)